MKAVRLGNDFTLKWTIMQDADTPLDTENIFEEHLYLICYGRKEELKTFQREANSISIDVTPTMAPIKGTYALEWYFKQKDLTYYKGYKNDAYDTPAFNIVGQTAKDDNIRKIEIVTITKKTTN
jgi:hypothetical protein